MYWPWNSLDNAVLNSKSVELFKRNLESYWANQVILHNYWAPLIVPSLIVNKFSKYI